MVSPPVYARNTEMLNDVMLSLLLVIDVTLGAVGGVNIIELHIHPHHRLYT